MMVGTDYIIFNHDSAAYEVDMLLVQVELKLKGLAMELVAVP